MPAPMLRVFVDAHPVDVAPGSTARDAVAARDPAVLSRLDDGTAYLTDGRGIRLDVHCLGDTLDGDRRSAACLPHQFRRVGLVEVKAHLVVAEKDGAQIADRCSFPRQGVGRRTGSDGRRLEAFGAFLR